VGFEGMNSVEQMGSESTEVGWRSLERAGWNELRRVSWVAW
jgi:hypothetical protein